MSGGGVRRVGAEGAAARSPGAGVGVGTLLTPLRADLRTRWPWIGGAICALLFLPNVLWQVEHGWPSIEFYRSLRPPRFTVSPTEQIGNEILVQNPAALPLWAAGAWLLLVSSRGWRFRPLGWWFATALVSALVGGSPMAYRIAGAFPAAFAAGAVLLEGARRPGAKRLQRL